MRLLELERNNVHEDCLVTKAIVRSISPFQGLSVVGAASRGVGPGYYIAALRAAPFAAFRTALFGPFGPRYSRLRCCLRNGRKISKLQASPKGDPFNAFGVEHAPSLGYHSGFPTGQDSYEE
jgi:hypothetical protein